MEEEGAGKVLEVLAGFVTQLFCWVTNVAESIIGCVIEVQAVSE